MQGQPRGWAVPVEAAIGEAKGVAVQCVPDRLVHIAQVEGRGLVVLIARNSVLTDDENIEDDGENGQYPGQSSLAFGCLESLPDDARALLKVLVAGYQCR